ncbi:membrane protein [Polaromonas sp. JS666]|uniref:membrane protein n=1 Tax=Polaromonas sp. (strain JS666 / ATCC BAA-500) TaxID=296591 RepID=UPI00004641D4|nr:membrane protein [Polaromonas sp. JS666]
MNKPSPAIIAQSAVRRLPRLALLLFCLAYVLPGFFGRGPWKYEDIAAFGVMRELTTSAANWLQPQLLGQITGFEALVPYWLGAVAIKGLPFLDPAFAVRIPFGLLLAMTLITTWYAIYYLARSPQAQPVAFAFGGEASPVDYARAIADAGLLALIASLGLAQLSHETTPALAQLGFTALVFYAMSASPYRRATKIVGPALGLLIGLAGLALSGAPTLALLLGVGGVLVEGAQLHWGYNQDGQGSQANTDSRRQSWHWVLLIAGATLLAALLAYALDLWRWRIQLPGASDQPAWRDWRRLGRLLLWFTWPTWPLALWTLWRWRRQLASRHVALPLWFAGMAVAATLTTTASDRSLLLSLPPLAALAAFALPTLKRSWASLIDWFTLLFFTGCAIIIWVVWIAMQTGVPRQPAANVAKLAPGFEPSFSWLAFLAAVAATLAWTWLVKWRAGAQRAAIWKSLVLPAGGATLCWLLLMTLWMPLLDYARSYAPMSRQIASLVDKNACVEIYGVDSAQAAALQYHGRLELRQATSHASCPYLVVDVDAQSTLSNTVNLPDWAFLATVRRPTDKNENVLVFKRVSTDNQARAAKRDGLPARP